MYVHSQSKTFAKKSQSILYSDLWILSNAPVMYWQEICWLWNVFASHGYIWEDLFVSYLLIESHIEHWNALQLAWGDACLLWMLVWVWMVQMCGCPALSLLLFFFFSSQFHFQSIVLAVVQGHYVMLIRAPHLEKCHWDTEFAELILEMKTCLWKTLVTKDTEPKRNSAGE